MRRFTYPNILLWLILAVFISSFHATVIHAYEVDQDANPIQLHLCTRFLLRYTAGTPATPASRDNHPAGNPAKSGKSDYGFSGPIP